jgi:hypothetical protein
MRVVGREAICDIPMRMFKEKVRYVMLWCPFYTPISAVSSWGWWLHATSASGRCAPATEHIWMRGYVGNKKP